MIPFTAPRAHCEFLNVCFPINETEGGVVPNLQESLSKDVDTNAPRKAETYPLPARMDGRPGAEARDLQNAIKVVHLTDIHIEQNYKEVSAVQFPNFKVFLFYRSIRVQRLVKLS